MLQRAEIVGCAALILWLAMGMLRATPSYAESVVTSRCPQHRFDAQSVSELAGHITTVANDSNSQSLWTADCASQALARKGDEVIPTLIHLMETHRPSVEKLALQAVCGLGHSGSGAVPYILKRLRAPGPPFDDAAYGALACIGRGAKSAIPFLTEKSLGETPGTISAEGDLAIETLGALAKYAPDTVIPHLTSLLDRPSHTYA